jgi:hypothetical protein
MLGHGRRKMSCVPIRLHTMCGSPRISSAYSKVARPSAAQLSSQTPAYPWTRFNHRPERAAAEVDYELLHDAPKGTLLLRYASRARTTRVRHRCIRRA